MAVSSYDIVLTSGQGATVAATMCSAPSYAVSGVRTKVYPKFAEAASINGVSYYAGSPLISYTGGTVVSSSPVVVNGATTSASSTVTLSGAYSVATTTAVITIPWGVLPATSTFYYESMLLNGSAEADDILSGHIYVPVTTPPRIPTTGGGGGDTGGACNVRQL